MGSQRTYVLAVVAAVLVLTGSCRSPGTASSAGDSVDDLARALAGSGDDAARWEQELRAANGGRTTVDDTIAHQLRTRTATVDAIWSASQHASDLACTAWTHGADEIVTQELITLTTRFEAQRLLDRMYDDTARGLVLADSVTFACELAGLADNGL